jgi:TolA-binding protein
MQRRFLRLAAFVALVLTVPPVPPAVAIDEPERLWLVGERAFADGLYPVARRALAQFVERYGSDARVPQASLMLGKALLTLGELDPALAAFQRAARAVPPPGQGLEARFWEAETLFRLKRFADARLAYDEVFRSDAGAPFAPDALYGFGWTELELKRPDSAVAVFRDFLQTWGEHELAPSATFQMARALLDLKRHAEALPLLASFAQKYPRHPRVADVQYMLASARLASGDLKNGFAELRAFVEAHPSHPQVAEARRQMQDILVKTGSKAQLQDVYAALMSQSPSTPDALLDALAIGKRLGRPQEDAAWKKLRADFPKHPQTLDLAFKAATAAFKKNHWREAVGYAEAVTASDDDATRAEAWLMTGESELKLKRYAQAAKAFEEVGGIETIETGVRYRALAGLGLAREELKDFVAAMAAYEAVAVKSTDPALKQWARERAGVVRAKLSKPAPPAPKGPAQKAPATKGKGGS